MVSLLLLVLLGIIIVMFCVLTGKKHNSSEIDAVEDLKKRIDELDEDNVEVNTAQGGGKIIVPDIVDPDESTRKSTQKEECKEYTVGPKQKIEKTVIGSNKQEEVFVNTEIERVEDSDDGPIKENEGFISKILKNNEE